MRAIPVSDDDAVRLFEEADLLDLGLEADRIRERRHPDGVISYIIDRNVNYTNVCKEFCSFCAFYRIKGDPEAYILSNEVIYQKMQETLDLGGTLQRRCIQYPEPAVDRLGIAKRGSRPRRKGPHPRRH